MLIVKTINLVHHVSSVWTFLLLKKKKKVKFIEQYDTYDAVADIRKMAWSDI